MSGLRGQWPLAAIVITTLLAGVLIGRSLLSESPEPGPLIFFPTTSTDLSQSQRDRAAARRHVRYAVPAAEVFFIDHGTYRGMTLEVLQRIEVGVEQVRVGFARDTTYCLESTSGAQTASYAGPSGPVRDEPCTP